MTKGQPARRITVGELEKAASGDRSAAGALADFIYGWVRSVLRDGPDIEDATQEAFVAVIVATRENHYDPARDDKHAWVVKIAVRKAIDVRRRRERERELLEHQASDEATDPVSEDPISRIERHRQAERVHGVVNELYDTDRALLLLRYNEEMSYEDIAKALGVPLGTVKSRLSRLLQKLKLRLEPAFSHSPRPERSPGDLPGSEP